MFKIFEGKSIISIASLRYWQTFLNHQASNIPHFLKEMILKNLSD